MPTIIYSKEEFIQMLEASMDETDVILMTQETKEMSTSDRKGYMKLDFIFALSCFECKGLNHIYQGLLTPMSVMLAKRSSLTPEALSHLKENQKLDSTPK